MNQLLQKIEKRYRSTTPLKCRMFGDRLLIISGSFAGFSLLTSSTWLTALVSIIGVVGKLLTSLCVEQGFEQGFQGEAVDIVADVAPVHPVVDPVEKKPAAVEEPVAKRKRTRKTVKNEETPVVPVIPVVERSKRSENRKRRSSK